MRVRVWGVTHLVSCAQVDDALGRKSSLDLEVEW